jgi:hypothetical protein
MQSERRIAVYSPPEADLPFIVSVADEDGVLFTVPANCAEEAEVLAALYRRTPRNPRLGGPADEALRAE